MHNIRLNLLPLASKPHFVICAFPAKVNSLSACEHLAACFSGWICKIDCMEIVFSVTQETDGGFVAECLSHDIFTQGDTWEQLRRNVQEAVSAYFFDQTRPSRVRLHLVRDELLAWS